MFFRMVYKSGQIFPPFCHNTRVWQTDGQTDRILIARPRLHCMQRGNKTNRGSGNSHVISLQKPVRKKCFFFVADLNRSCVSAERESSGNRLYHSVRNCKGDKSHAFKRAKWSHVWSHELLCWTLHSMLCFFKMQICRAVLDDSSLHISIYATRDLQGQNVARDKDGSHTVRSAISENPTLHANCTALSSIKQALLLIDVSNCRDWEFRVIANNNGRHEFFVCTRKKT